MVVVVVVVTVVAVEAARTTLPPEDPGRHFTLPLLFCLPFDLCVFAFPPLPYRRPCARPVPPPTVPAVCPAALPYRVMDVQPSSALMLWGEKPTIPADEMAAMRYNSSTAVHLLDLYSGVVTNRNAMPGIVQVLCATAAVDGNFRSTRV